MEDKLPVELPTGNLYYQLFHEVRFFSIIVLINLVKKKSFKVFLQ